MMSKVYFSDDNYSLLEYEFGPECLLVMKCFVLWTDAFTKAE